MTPDRLQRAAAWTEIRQVQNRYADIVTRRAWDELAEIMRPDCRLQLDLGDRELEFVGPAAIGEFIGTSLEQFSFFEFVILNTVIDIHDDRAGARMYMQEIRQNHSDGRRTDAYGVYHDRFEHDGDGRWSIAQRWYQSFARTASPESPGELDVIGFNPMNLGDL